MTTIFLYWLCVSCFFLSLVCIIVLSFSVPRMLKNLTCLLRSSMRTLMRSTVLIFYENTALLCCISLTLAYLNSRLPNSISPCRLLHRSLWRGNFINSLPQCLASVVATIVLLILFSAQREMCTFTILKTRIFVWQICHLSTLPESGEQMSVDNLHFMLLFKLIWAQRAWQVKAVLWAPSGLSPRGAFGCWWSV